MYLCKMDEKTQKFYEDYILTNENYVEKEVYPLENIRGPQDKILLSTKYGNIKRHLNKIKTKKDIDIELAVDKTEFFKNILKEKFPETSNLLVFKSNYIKSSEKMIFGTKYGDVNIKPNNLMSGMIPTIKSAVDKTIYFKNMLKECNPEVFEKLVFESDYISAKQKMFFSTKYGSVGIIPDSLLYKKSELTIESSINKTQYCINQFKEVHRDKYDYSLVEYVNNRSTLTIICKKHGQFYTSHSSHYHKKSGCIQCVLEEAKGFFANEKIRERNKQKYKNIPAKLYILKFKTKEENFYKVGVTKQSMRGRLYSIKPYYPTILKTIKTNLYDAIVKEQELLEHFEEYKYIPKHKFGGYTECISVNPLENLKIKLTDF